MPKKAKKAAREFSFAAIRPSLRTIFTIAKGAVAGGEFYRVDRNRASEYFRSHSDWFGRILDFTDELHAKDIPLVYLDVCGRTLFDYRRHAWHYNFSLQPAKAFRQTSSQEVRVEGNIFSSRDFTQLITTLRQSGHRPFLITFEPIAGLNLYLPSEESGISKEVVYGSLEKRLAALVEVLLPGGFIFLGQPMQFLNTADFFARKTQEEYGSTLRIRELCKTLRCSFEMHSSITGPYWLLRKYRSAK
jgi:hypothetical protein